MHICSAIMDMGRWGRVGADEAGYVTNGADIDPDELLFRKTVVHIYIYIYIYIYINNYTIYEHIHMTLFHLLPNRLAAGRRPAPEKNRGLD